MSEKISDETMKQLEFLSEVTHKRWYELGQSDSFAIAEAVKVLRALRDPWQPIETAPKDGTPILLWGIWAGEISGPAKSPAVEIGYYSGEGDYQGFFWAATGGDAYAIWCKPTHWMPLPAAPSVTIEGEKE